MANAFLSTIIACEIKNAFKKRKMKKEICRRKEEEVRTDVNTSFAGQIILVDKNTSDKNTLWGAIIVRIYFLWTSFFLCFFFTCSAMIFFNLYETFQGSPLMNVDKSTFMRKQSLTFFVKIWDLRVRIYTLKMNRFSHFKKKLSFRPFLTGCCFKMKRRKRFHYVSIRFTKYQRRSRDGVVRENTGLGVNFFIFAISKINKHIVPSVESV